MEKISMRMCANTLCSKESVFMGSTRKECPAEMLEKFADDTLKNYNMCEHRIGKMRSKDIVFTGGSHLETSGRKAYVYNFDKAYVYLVTDGYFYLYYLIKK